MTGRLAMGGDLALLSGPAKLVLRYERDAWRRYRESIREVQAPAPPPVVAAPVPDVVGRPEVREQAVAQASPSLAGASPLLAGVADRPGDRPGGDRRVDR